MKFTKLTKKLLLSALSLGLAVVTLTTTTFAWYTSSTEAGAVGQGQTSGTTEDSTLEITTEYNGDVNASVWTKNVTVDPSGQMTPVAWTGSSYVSVDNNASTGYYQFKLYFKTAKTVYYEDIAVYLKNMVISNTTKGDKLPEYNNLLSNMAERPNTVPEGATYAIDAVRALDMVITSGSTTTGYELSDLFNYETTKEKGYTSTLDALEYYKAVMGTAPSATASGSLTKLTHESNELKVQSGQYVEVGKLVNKTSTTTYDVLEVEFTIFLNGWDKYCFDACKGQNFSVSLEFTTAGKNI